MTTTTALFVFAIVWWLVFFMALPFGVRRAETPEPGTDSGAPEQPRLWQKALATTAIAAVLTVVLHYAIEWQWLPLRAWLTVVPNANQQ
jgi:predicted secreted protein